MSNARSLSAIAAKIVAHFNTQPTLALNKIIKT